MSDAGYSVDSQDVKSKIASFEAFNETVRSVDSPERRSAAGISPVSASSTNKLLHRSSEQPVELTHQDSTTTVASQNRKSRLQKAITDKRHNQPEPGSLMQKRLSAKERRLASLQQQQLEHEQESSTPLQEMSHLDLKEQRQPSSRHGNSRNQQQMSPMGTNGGLTSPSSLSHSRSPARGPGQPHNNNLLISPNMAAATAAAQQHRASNYSNNYSGHQQQQQQQQHQQLNINGSSGSSGEQDAATSKAKASISRFHKLKMKGMDHAKLAQKRKQAAQKSSNNRKERTHRGESPKNNQPSSSSPGSSSQRHSSRQQQQQHAMHQRQEHQHNSSSPRQPTHHHAPVQNQGSPDQPLTDDDATLTSVARLYDDQNHQQNFPSSHQDGTTLNNHQHAPSYTNHQSGNLGLVAKPPPPRLWVAEEKSEKAPEYSPQHRQPSHNVGIYPRPSSSSEFEPEVHHHQQQHHNSRNHNPYAMRSSPQHQNHTQRHQYQQHQQSSYQSSYHNHHQEHQQYGGGHGNNNHNNGYNSMRSPSNHHHQQQQQQQQYYNSPPQAAAMMSPQDRVGSGGLLRRNGGSYASNGGQHQFYDDEDERTFDYGVRDDDSQGSTTFQQQLLEAERKAREQSHLSEGNTTNMSTHSADSVSRPTGRNGGATPPLLKTDDPMDQYRQYSESPAMKTAAGVIGAATVGCIVIGPVGMLLGAAAVGIGVGVMQIPPEERSNMANRASTTMNQMQEQALNASEVLSTSCATTYKDSGISEHLPPEMSKFCAVSEDDVDPVNVIDPDIKSQDSEAVRLDQVTGPCGGGVVTANDLPRLKNHDTRKPASPNQTRSLRSKKVACLRHVRIVPVSQIHGLDPVSQPRAWLDVVASADTSNDEKTEAMEEILLLCKDKMKSRVFLEEGVLDSIMWILSRYQEKVNKKPTDVWANPDISRDEKNAATMAAKCCVTLGKAHCAAIHTEGDLLLMSLYERGTVPEERQLAQMLYECPHHTRVTKTNDPTVVDPSTEVFALKQLTLPQAEELAKSIKALADGVQQ